MLRRAEHYLTFTQIRTRSTELNRSLTQNLIVSQNRFRSTQLIRIATSTLTVQQEAFRQRVFVDTSNSLTIIQSPVYYKITSRILNQTLPITQNRIFSRIMFRSAIQHVVFQNFRQRKLGSTIVNVPNIQAATVPTYNPQFVGPIHALKIHRVPTFVILQVPSRTIVLPGAELNNSDSFPYIVDVKRTVTGDVYTYIKRVYTQQLKYSFVLWKDKALELKQFIAEHGAEPITVWNWNNERWVAYLVLESVSFQYVSLYEHQEEKVLTNLEFEGIRI